MDIISYEQLILDDYKSAIASNCFQGSFEEFEEWSIQHCWGVRKNGHPDPPGKPGREGPPSPG